jgi:hypothetical protein
MSNVIALPIATPEAALPEDLAAAFGALHPRIRELIAGSRRGAAFSASSYIFACVGRLHDAGWTLERVHALAEHFPAGLGSATADVISAEWREHEVNKARFAETAARLTENFEAKEAAAKAERREASLWVDTDDWNEADLPRRPWIVPGYALRGSVTVVSGAGGVAKSALTAAWCVAVATGQAIGSFAPLAPGKALLLNVEDDMVEQRLRLSAILRQAGRKPADIAGRLIRVGPNGIGTLLERDPVTKRMVMTAAMERIEELIEEHKPDLVVFDPLVELHDSEENDNGALRAVMARFRAVAKQHNAAIVIVHHVKKGLASIAGDADATRGASSIVGAARIVITLAAMSKDEASAFGFSDRHAKGYFRVDGAKANYSELTDTEWFERHPYLLDNGETVIAPVPWSPPKSAANDDVIAEILAGIAAGSPDGPWSPQFGPGLRSVRQLFNRHGINGTGQQSKLLAALTSEHGLTVCMFPGADRKPAKGLRTAEGLPAARWIDAPV